MLAAEIRAEFEKLDKKVLHMNSRLGEIIGDPKGKAILEQAMEAGAERSSTAEASESVQMDVARSSEMMVAIMEAMPLSQLLSFASPGVMKEALEQLIGVLNAQ